MPMVGNKPVGANLDRITEAEYGPIEYRDPWRRNGCGIRCQATDNEVFERLKLTMPMLAVGGEKSFGPLQAVIMRNVATNVHQAVVCVRALANGRGAHRKSWCSFATSSNLRRLLQEPTKTVATWQGKRLL